MDAQNTLLASPLKAIAEIPSAGRDRNWVVIMTSEWKTISPSSIKFKP